MSGTREISIRDISPGLRQIVVRDEALVSIYSWDYFDVVGETAILLPNPPPPVPAESVQCKWISNGIVHLSGTHKTEENGEIDIHLSKFVRCLEHLTEHLWHSFMASWPHFIATAESALPVFVTCTIGVAPVPPPTAEGRWDPVEGLDVAVKVRSWRHDGAPAPHVAFNWIAIAKRTTWSGGSTELP